MRVTIVEVEWNGECCAAMHLHSKRVAGGDIRQGSGAQNTQIKESNPGDSLAHRDVPLLGSGAIQSCGAFSEAKSPLREECEQSAHTRTCLKRQIVIEADNTRFLGNQRAYAKQPC